MTPDHAALRRDLEALKDAAAPARDKLAVWPSADRDCLKSFYLSEARFIAACSPDVIARVAAGALELIDQRDALEREVARLLAAPLQDGYEYRITQGERKAWDGLPDLSLEGWEEYREWERFDYHEERYWRRRASEPKPEPR